MRKLLVFFFSCCFLLLPQVSGAGDEAEGKETIKAPPGNIGFMKNPPQELRDRFPICDAFLQVDWISKEKRIGQSHFELYKEGEKIGVMDALVYLSDTVFFERLNLYEIKRNGNLEKLKTALQKGTIKRPTLTPMVTYGNYQQLLHSNHTRGGGYSYSSNRQNVCIAYPDHERVWLAEGKKVGEVYSSSEIDEKYKIVSQSIPQLTRSWFEDMNIVDINFDNVNDYIKSRLIIYSFNGKYFENERKGLYWEKGRKFYQWSFPATEKECDVILRHGYHITFDGNSYFFGNQCNLTELTGE